MPIPEHLPNVEPALARAPLRAGISARFVAGLTASLVLHAALLGLLLMRQGSAGPQDFVPTSALWVDWQTHQPAPPTPRQPPQHEPETLTPARAVGAAASEPRSIVAAPAAVSAAPAELFAPDPAVTAATATETRDHDVSAATAASDHAAAAPSAEDAYLWDVLAHLRRFQHYPEPARQRGIEGTVWLRARVSRRGVVLRSEIEHSSGHALLDAAAARLINRASPLPPPPAGAFAITELSLPVEYRLRRE